MPQRLDSLGLTALLATLAMAAFPAGALGAQWYKTDLHRHTVVSADARTDLGIVANNMQALGYNAVFLTDHDRGSRFDIHGAWANDTEIHDGLGAFATKTYGAASARTNQFVTAPVNSGTKSLHLAVTSTGGGESMVWSNRGPNFRSGDIILDFYVNPVRIDPAAGVFVSASIGGDATVGTPPGYTTSAGAVSPGKSTLLVWQLGNARADSTNAQSRVITHGLPYTLNTWNHYTINVTTGATSWNGNPVSGAGNGLADIPEADRPQDINALSMLKLGVRGNTGTADAYFDDYVLKASAPQCPSAEFAYRNSLVRNYDVPGSFQMFPGREMGQTKHAQHFDFPITTAADFENKPDASLCAATNTPSAPWHFNLNGTDGIPAVHASQYPTQQNHPGTTDSVANVVSTKASGGDAVEAAGQLTDWTGPWDQILGTNHPIMGVTGSDSHAVVSSGGDLATYISSPTLGMDDLMHAYFEGRMFVAPNNFSGQVRLNLDGSADPFPARYPVYVPASRTTADVKLDITGGLASGETVRWVTNNGSGATSETVTPSGSSYQATKSIPLGGAFTYVRAEVRNSAGRPRALSQPIFFRSVANLPDDKSVRVQRITTSSGRNYTNVSTKGITSVQWSTATDKLALTLTNPADTRTDLIAHSSTAPVDVAMNGSPVGAAATLADHQAATGSSWFYDAAAGIVHLRDVQPGGTSDVVLTFGQGGGADTQAPSVPGGLSATAISDTAINLSWSASIDDTAVTGYTIFRNATEIATVNGDTTSYADTGLTGGTAYTYTVDAFDAAGNHSDQSASASATTFAAPGTTTTFNPVADAYVDASVPGSNFGTLTSVRVDASPDTQSYLRFNVSGLAGTIVKATLSMRAGSANAQGWSVYGLSDNTWTETGITYANKPAAAATQTGASGPIAAAGYTNADVTSLVTGNGVVNLVLKGTSSTQINFGSREAASTKPKLIIQTAAAGSDTEAPSVPSGLTATAAGTSQIDLSWTASTDNTAVTGYTIYRNGTEVTTVGDSTTTYSDTGLAASTTYTYTVDAFDAAGNHSAKSSSASATTASPPGTPVTLAPVADAYVDGTLSLQDTNFGTATTIRADGSPDTLTYLRFNVTGVTGTITKATLKLRAGSANTIGWDVYGLSANLWSETAITYNNRPVMEIAPTPTGSSGPIAGAGFTSADVTPLVTGPGLVSFVVKTTSNTQINMSSREATAANRPQLVIETA